MLRILGRDSSSNVQKVLWLCTELAVPFVREDYGGKFGKTKDATYLALNPNSLVPTIIEDDFVLWESNSIVRYLAGKYDDGKWLPRDLRGRARVERWMDWQLSVVAPAFGPLFIGLVRTPPEQRDRKSLDAHRDRVAAAMAILDRTLAGENYLSGPAPTVADIAVGIYVYRWFKLNIEREELPNLRAYFDRLAGRPAYRTHVMVELT